MPLKPEIQAPPSFMEWKELASLVGSIRTRSLVARPRTIEQCREALAYCRRNGMTICARGAGRGYGDVALNDGQALLDMSAMNRILAFDEAAALITVEAGIRIIDIYQAVHHRLLMLAASPTESHSSVAGAMCANVNGKDAWHHGSFAHQVVRLTFLLANGEVIRIDRSHELFNAVLGGIGLLGIILEATLRLIPIPSPFVEINRIPAPDVDALLATMSRVEKSHDAAVVWVDAYAHGRKIGRSVIHAAKWIERHDTESQRREILAAGYERLERPPPIRPGASRKIRSHPVAPAARAAPHDEFVQPALLRHVPAAVPNETVLRTPNSSCGSVSRPASPCRRPTSSAARADTPSSSPFREPARAKRLSS